MAIDGVVFELRGVDHEDQRRAMITAFNGDLDGFYARRLLFLRPSDGEMRIEGEGSRYTSPFRTLCYILEGNAQVKLSGNKEKPENYNLCVQDGQRARLLVPKFVNYEIKVESGSILALASEMGDNFGMYGAGSRAKTALSTAFQQNFRAEQVKFALMKIDARLADHYHPDYREFFYMLKGEADFTLELIDSKERTQEHLNPGDHLLISPRVGHKALVKQGSVLVGCTEKPYISAAINDCPYTIED